MEDIVAVLDGRSEVVSEIREATGELRNHLTERFRDLLNNKHFLESLPGHMPGDEASQARVRIIIERISEIATLRTP
jgi:hypothetical protein